jgi:hypothetical protein
MSFEQIVSILPVILFITGSCLFLWVTRERPAAARPGQPAESPLPEPANVDDETVAVIAAALRRQGKC